jgi:hypothetical protein
LCGGFSFGVHAAADEVASDAKPGSLASAVEPFVTRQELAGAVMLVADKSRVLTHEAAGFADVAARKPMPLDAVFWIASQRAYPPPSAGRK